MPYIWPFIRIKRQRQSNVLIKQRQIHVLIKQRQLNVLFKQTQILTSLYTSSLSGRGRVGEGYLLHSSWQAANMQCPTELPFYQHHKDFHILKLELFCTYLRA